MIQKPFAMFGEAVIFYAAVVSLSSALHQIHLGLLLQLYCQLPSHYMPPEKEGEEDEEMK
jgi:hypothetical protein